MSKENMVFPQFGSDLKNEQSGLSLRDYFATSALKGILSNSATMSAYDRIAVKSDIPLSDLIAAMAFKYGDAMLKAREGK